MKLSCAIFYSFVTTAVGATDTGSSQDQDAIVRPKLRALNATQGDLLRHEDAHSLKKLFDSLPESQIHALLSDDVSTKRSNLRAAGTEEGPVTKSDEDLEEPKGISMMDLESLLSSHDILPLLKDKIGEESGVDEESESYGNSCNSHDDCPEGYPKCWNAGNPGSRCIGHIGDDDANYKKHYFTISVKLHNRDLFLSASNKPLNCKRSKHVHFVHYDQSTQEGRDSLAMDYFAHWRFEDPKEMIDNGHWSSCELDDCRIIINRGKGMPLAVHKGPLRGAGRSDAFSIDDNPGVLVTPLEGFPGEDIDEHVATHYSHYVMHLHRAYPETTWRMRPNLRPNARVVLEGQKCAWPSWLYGKDGTQETAYTCPLNKGSCVGYRWNHDFSSRQWGKCYVFFDGFGNNMAAWGQGTNIGGFQVAKHGDSDCDPWNKPRYYEDCYYYLKVTDDRSHIQHVTIAKLTADPPRDVNDMGASSYDKIADLSDATRDLTVGVATEAAGAAFPGAALGVEVFMDMAWSDNSEEKALQKLAQQVLDLAYQQTTSEIAKSNVQNGNDSLSLARLGFLVAYTAMKNKYVKNGDENAAYFLDDLQLLVVKLESIIDTHNQGISIYLSDSDYDMYDTVTVKTAQTGFKLLKLSYMELILMVNELTGLHSYVRVKRGESFECSELVDFVKKISLFENTNSVLTSQRNMLIERRKGIMNGNSPWHDMRVDPQSSSSSVGYSMDRYYEGDDRTFKKFYKTTDSNSYNMRDKATFLYKIETMKDMRKMQHYDIAGELQALDAASASLVDTCEKVKTTPDWFKNG